MQETVEVQQTARKRSKKGKGKSPEVESSAKSIDEKSSAELIEELEQFDKKGWSHWIITILQEVVEMSHSPDEKVGLDFIV